MLKISCISCNIQQRLEGEAWDRLSDDWLVEVARRIHTCAADDAPTVFLQQLAHMAESTFLGVEPNHHLWTKFIEHAHN